MRLAFASAIHFDPDALIVRESSIPGKRLPSLDLSYNAYFLSLKAYTENGGPDWKDPADIHNQMRQFDVMTDRLIHGPMRFDAEWRSDTISKPKQESATPR